MAAVRHQQTSGSSRTGQDVIQKKACTEVLMQLKNMGCNSDNNTALAALSEANFNVMEAVQLIINKNFGGDGETESFETFQEVGKKQNKKKDEVVRGGRGGRGGFAARGGAARPPRDNANAAANGVQKTNGHTEGSRGGRGGRGGRAGGPGRENVAPRNNVRGEKAAEKEEEFPAMSGPTTSKGKGSNNTNAGTGVNVPATVGGVPNAWAQPRKLVEQERPKPQAAPKAAAPSNKSEKKEKKAAAGPVPEKATPQEPKGAWGAPSAEEKAPAPEQKQQKSPQQAATSPAAAPAAPAQTQQAVPAAAAPATNIPTEAWKQQPSSPVRLPMSSNANISSFNLQFGSFGLTDSPKPAAQEPAAQEPAAPAVAAPATSQATETNNAANNNNNTAASASVAAPAPNAWGQNNAWSNNAAAPKTSAAATTNAAPSTTAPASNETYQTPQEQLYNEAANGMVQTSAAPVDMSQMPQYAGYMGSHFAMPQQYPYPQPGFEGGEANGDMAAPSYLTTGAYMDPNQSYAGAYRPSSPSQQQEQQQGQHQGQQFNQRSNYKNSRSNGQDNKNSVNQQQQAQQQQAQQQQAQQQQGYQMMHQPLQMYGQPGMGLQQGAYMYPPYQMPYQYYGHQGFYNPQPHQPTHNARVYQKGQPNGNQGSNSFQQQATASSGLSAADMQGNYGYQASYDSRSKTATSAGEKSAYGAYPQQHYNYNMLQQYPQLHGGQQQPGQPQGNRQAQPQAGGQYANWGSMGSN